MKRLIAFIVALGLLVSFAARARADMRIVATTPDLAAIAREVGGSHVTVTALALHSQDPHFVDPRPHLALDLAKADLLLATGLDLEIGWLPTLQTGSRNGSIQKGSPGYLDCSTLVSLLEVPSEKVDRSQGDVHPQGNPHYLLDPRRGAKVAVGIARRMGEIDPANAAAYESAAKQLSSKLDSARKGWESKLSGARGKKIVAYHRSLPYLADWLGLDVVEHLEPRPGIPPNPRHVAHVIDIAKQQDARAIVQQSFYPDNVSKLVAKRAGVAVCTLPGGPDFRAGQSYEKYIDRVVKALKKAL